MSDNMHWAQRRSFIRSIKNAEHLSEDEVLKLAGMYKPGTADYDQVIERLYFYGSGSNANWKNRLEYSIMTVRSQQENAAREITTDFTAH